MKKPTTISNFSRLLRARAHPYAFLLACVATLLVPDVATATKYRTVATGNWSAIASWERSVDGGQSWAPAGAGQTPGSAAGDTVLILSSYWSEVYRRISLQHEADGFVEKSALKDGPTMLFPDEQADRSLLAVKFAANAVGSQKSFVG